MVGGVTAAPAVWKEKREMRRERADVRKRDRAAAEKKKWEEKLKNHEGEDGSTNGEAAA